MFNELNLEQERKRKEEKDRLAQNYSVKVG